MPFVALLVSPAWEPESATRYLAEYGPMALLVFAALVLFPLARKMNSPELKNLRQRVYAGFWLSVFVLGILICIAYFRRSEYVVTGVIKTFTDGETVHSRQELFLREHATAGPYFYYDWRLITDKPFTGPLVIAVQKRGAEANHYEINIKPAYYQGTVELDYDRPTGTFKVTHGTDTATVSPFRLARRENRQRSLPFGLAFAAVEPKLAPVSIEELVSALDAENPLIREKARSDLASQNPAIALPRIEKILLDPSSSSRRRLGALSALAMSSNRVRLSLSSQARCAIAKMGSSEVMNIRAAVGQLAKTGVTASSDCEAFIDPIALSYEPRWGVIALNEDGRVYTVDPQSRQSAKTLFTVPETHRPSDFTITSQGILVSANSEIGCVVFAYSFESAKLSTFPLQARTRCSGITAISDTVFLGIKGIRGATSVALLSWRLSEPQRKITQPLESLQSVGRLSADAPARRILVSDPVDGKLYSLTTADQSLKPITDRGGYMTALTLNRDYILIASGKKVLFLSRQDDKGRNPPAAVRDLSFDQVTGLAVDRSGALWVADQHRHLILGPIELSN